MNGLCRLHFRESISTFGNNERYLKRICSTVTTSHYLILRGVKGLGDIYPPPCRGRATPGRLDVRKNESEGAEGGTRTGRSLQGCHAAHAGACCNTGIISQMFSSRQMGPCDMQAEQSGDQISVTLLGTEVEGAVGGAARESLGPGRHALCGKAASGRDTVLLGR